MSLPTTGIGTGFMPNFGIDIPMNLNMKPALSHPGAPARPGNPDKKGRKHVSGVSTGINTFTQLYNDIRFSTKYLQ